MSTHRVSAESIPQHILAGKRYHEELDVLADKIDRDAADMRGHVEAAEALQIGGEVLAMWTDAADMLAQAAALIRSANETAEAAARLEQEKLTPLVEAATDATDLGDNATVGSLRD